MCLFQTLWLLFAAIPRYISCQVDLMPALHLNPDPPCLSSRLHARQLDECTDCPLPAFMFVVRSNSKCPPQLLDAESDKYRNNSKCMAGTATPGKKPTDPEQMHGCDVSPLQVTVYEGVHLFRYTGSSPGSGTVADSRRRGVAL
jgi:hypothetical protein